MNATICLNNWNAYTDALKPTTIPELDLVQRMVADKLRIRRAWAIKTALTHIKIVQNQQKTEVEYPDPDNDIRLGPTLKRAEKDLAPIQHTEERSGRSIDRALARFERYPNFGH
jgi:hypothetical protein